MVFLGSAVLTHKSVWGRVAGGGCQLLADLARSHGNISTGWNGWGAPQLRHRLEIGTQSLPTRSAGESRSHSQPRVTYLQSYTVKSVSTGRGEESGANSYHQLKDLGLCSSVGDIRASLWEDPRELPCHGSLQKTLRLRVDRVYVGKGTK